MNLRNAFPGQLLASGPCTPGGQEVASSNLVAPIEKAVLRAAFSIEQVSSREEKNVPVVPKSVNRLTCGLLFTLGADMAFMLANLAIQQKAVDSAGETTAPIRQNVEGPLCFTGAGGR